MTAPDTKAIFMLCLVACYGVQTILVYMDERGAVQLQGAELEGARLWHANNCQSCHQFYGFGGFLGPDLTNVAARARIERLEQVLSQGSGQMPAFPDVSAQGTREIWAYLEAMNRTGQGEARIAAPNSGSRQQRLDAALGARLPQDSAERRGHELLLRRACSACHVHFAPGVAGAPDQTSVVSRLDDSAILDVLRHGRAGTAMPAPVPPFSDGELTDTLALLHWTWRHREELMQATAGPAPQMVWSELPWWEYGAAPAAGVR